MSIPIRLQPQPYVVPPCVAELEVLFADGAIVVVHKPSGLLSVPGKDARNADSVYTRLLAEHDELFVVHRLDLSTSGIMLLALSKTVAGELGKQFQARTVSKRYVAVVDGLINTDEGQVNLPIICDWPNRPVQKVCYETGKSALTYFRVLARDDQLKQTRVELVPHTGRSHQLRIHMRELGHPILGCEMYAPDAICYAAERLLLHAEYLSFQHPVLNTHMEFQLPAEF